MVKVQFEGKIDSYQGKKLDKAIEFSGECSNYETVDEAKQAGVWPNEKAVLDTINDGLVTSAKAKEYQANTKDLKAAYEKSDEYKVANFRKSAKLAEMDEGVVETLIAQKFPNFKG